MLLAEDSVVRQPADEPSLRTIVKTVGILAGTIQGQQELKRLGCLERVRVSICNVLATFNVPASLIVTVLWCLCLLTEHRYP